jgi:O-antigen biosynthesis protein WbqP
VGLIEERDKYQANDYKPGITGWAQANGRDEINIYEKARMDGEYVDQFGIVMDIRCLVKTVETIVFSKGYKEGSVQPSIGTYSISPTTTSTSSVSSNAYSNASSIQ